jgi:hypothetical protein
MGMWARVGLTSSPHERPLALMSLFLPWFRGRLLVRGALCARCGVDARRKFSCSRTSTPL